MCKPSLGRVTASSMIVLTLVGLPVLAAPSEATDSPELEEIVVTGFRRVMQQAIDLKREAIGIRDSIVAEDIGKFPEQNIAESLQRIPGISMSRDGASDEGQRISIRGLSTQYAVTTINGSPVHTTSSGNVGSATRDFNYDVFPSELFGRVDVYKTPTASLEEGGIAGNVDLQTPRPFDNRGQVIRYSVAANYNTASGKWNPRASAVYSNTWGKFGALVGVAFSENVNQRSGFQSTGGYNSSALGSNSYVSPQPNPPLQSGTFPFELDLNNPKANFGSYTRDQIANAYLPRFFRAYSSNNDRKRIGVVSSFQYKTDRLDISLDGIYSKLSNEAAEYTFGVAVRNSRTVPGTKDAPGRGTNSGIIPLDVRIDRYNNLYGTFGNTSYLGESYFRDGETDFKYVILRGSYQITNKLKISAQANFSQSEAWYSANRVVSNIFGVTSTYDPTVNVTYPTIRSSLDFTDPRNFTAPSLDLVLNQEIDRERTARAYLDWSPGEWLSTDWSARLGGSWVSTPKQVIQQKGTSIATNRILPNGKTFGTLDVFSYMNPSIEFGRIDNGGNAGFPSNWATFPRSFLMKFLDANGANKAAPVEAGATFRAVETVMAAFGEINGTTQIFGRELRGNIGIRYASTDVDINNYTNVGQPAGVFSPAKSSGHYSNLMPSFTLALDVMPDLVLRASGAQTVTRQALSNIAANIRIPNVYNAEVTVGNPSLLPQKSSQADGSLEWYFNGGGLVSAGAFYKKIEGGAVAKTQTVPFGSLGLPQTAFDHRALQYEGLDFPADMPVRVTQYVNQSSYNLSGLEFAYQQEFSFLPEPFDGFGAAASFTKPFTSGNNFITTDGKSFSVSTVPEYRFSVTGYYEKGPFSIRASYNYQDKFAQSASNNGNDQIAYTSGQGFLDLTTSYVFSDAIQLRLDMLNLTDEISYTYYEDPRQEKGSGEASRRDNSFFNGRTITITLRGKF